MVTGMPHSAIVCISDISVIMACHSKRLYGASSAETVTSNSSSRAFDAILYDILCCNHQQWPEFYMSRQSVLHACLLVIQSISS